MKKLRIAVDLDGVVVDYLPVWCSVYNAMTNSNITVNDVTDWDVYTIFNKLSKEVVDSILEQERIFATMPPIKGAIEGVKELICMGHEVWFVSAALYKYAFIEKYEWLSLYFDGDYSFLKNRLIGVSSSDSKVILEDSFDVIIDDRYATIEAIKCPIRILMDAPYNRDKRTAIGMQRARSWEDIIELIRTKTESFWKWQS